MGCEICRQEKRLGDPAPPSKKHRPRGRAFIRFFLNTRGPCVSAAAAARYIAPMNDKSPESDAADTPKPYSGKKRGRKPGGNNGISKRIKDALRLIIDHGFSKRRAAETAGLNEGTLYIALKKPHVISYMTDLIAERNVTDAALARRTLADLAANSSSDQVRYQAALALADRLGGLPKDETKQAVSGPAHSIMIVPYGVTPPAQLIGNQSPESQKRIEQQAVIDVPSEPAAALTPMDGGRADGREPGGGG